MPMACCSSKRAANLASLHEGGSEADGGSLRKNFEAVDMKFDQVELDKLDITVIDGDRGKNYPHKDELLNTGYCLFLSANNVTKNGFEFSNNVYITKEKDDALHNGRLSRNDIVITTRGTVGNVGIYDETIKFEHMRINSGMLIVRCGQNIDNRFLYNVLRSKDFASQIDSIRTGSAQPQLPKSHFLKMVVPSIPLHFQRRIANILGALDDKIALNQQINKNLEEQAQAIFKAWFMDSPDRYTWDTGTFSEIIESTLGGDWGKESPIGKYTEMVYCIRGADIQDVNSGNKGKMPTRFILPNNYKNKRLIADDIVVEISGGSPTQSTGRVAAVTQSLLDRYDKGMVCTNFCRAIKPKQGYSMFIYYYWQFLYGQNVFFSYENGTTGIKNLDLNGFISNEKIILPPQKLITEFDNICKAFSSIIFSNGLENERLANLRDALLPRLMSGEIDVSKIEL